MVLLDQLNFFLVGDTQGLAVILDGAPVSESEMGDQDTSGRTAEITPWSVAFERLDILRNILDVSEQLFAEVGLREMSVEVAAVLQRRGFVALAQSTLDPASRLLLGRHGVTAVANNHVRSVLAFSKQVLLQIEVAHPVEAAEMSQQSRTVDADETTFRTRERRRDRKVGRQGVVEVLRQVVAPTFLREGQRTHRTSESRRRNQRRRNRIRRIHPTLDHRLTDTGSRSVGEVFRGLFGELDDGLVRDAVVQQDHGLVRCHVVALGAAEGWNIR